MPAIRHAIDDILSSPAATAMSETMRVRLHDAAMRADDESGDAPALLDATLQALAKLHADGESVLAAVLHARPGWATAFEALAQPVAKGTTAASSAPAHIALLDGLQAARQVWALHAERPAAGNAEGLRRLLLAIVRDLRVVPILLARQLALMRAAGALPDAERRALAQLTRDIHAPLANRLGIWQLKWELEDLAFRHLDADTYRRIAQLLDDKRAGRESYIEQVRRALDAALAAQGVRADVAGRPKHIYSIHKKMQKKDVPIGELYDLRAVRVLVDDVPSCYAALGVVHALWLPVPSEFDDYIARPKNNDYRSLHTAVIGPEGKTLEVQIRTHEMHAQAELGVAAHWRYKEHAYAGQVGSQRSSASNAANDRKIEWMRRLLDSHVDDARDADGVQDDRGLAGGLHTELVEDRIYVLTPIGEVIDLPVGATPLDFAYHVHTMVGHRCRGAKIDGRIVPLDHVLHSGDRVEILTAKVAEPRRDWLLASNHFLASARSREKVRTWFHKLDRAHNLQAGRDMLDKELKRLGLAKADVSSAFEKFNVTTLDDLHVLVALGDVGPHQVARALLEFERQQRDAAQAPVEGASTTVVPRQPRRGLKTAALDFTVVGVGNLLVQIARCCQPVPGDAVAGYLTRAKGVTVHRTDCASFLRLQSIQPQRVLPVEWGRGDGAPIGGGHQAAVTVDAVDRKYLLKDLTNLIAQEDVHVLSIQTEHGASSAGSPVRLRLQLRVQDFGQLSRLLGKIDSLPGVQQARRA